MTRTDTYPLPRVGDSVDKIGVATFITKLDLVKGYWQVPLTDSAKQIARFVVNGTVYQCLKNVPATFQRLMDRVVDGVENCVVYIDDVIVFDTCWEEHLDHVEKLILRLNEAGLVVNLQKCEFVQTRVQNLGYVVGHGQVYPPRDKVETINTFAAPHCRRALQRFLSMIGYYRRFIPEYSTVLVPLTDLLRKDKKWEWSAACELAFTTIRHPILRAPDINRSFVLAVDANQLGAGLC